MASKLEDHGLKIVHKHHAVLVKMADVVLFTFNRTGNLYAATIKPVNSPLAVKDKNCI